MIAPHGYSQQGPLQSFPPGFPPMPYPNTPSQYWDMKDMLQQLLRGQANGTMEMNNKQLPNRVGTPQIAVDIDDEEREDFVEYSDISAANSIEPEINTEPELDQVSEQEAPQDKPELDRVSPQVDKASPNQPPKPAGKKKDTPSRPPPYKPPLPFPGRFKKQLLEKHKAKFEELMKDLELKLPFIDVLMLIPPYQKFLKDAVQQRTKEVQGMVVLNRECSAIIQRKVISDKKEDSGSFTLPCMIGPLTFKNSLCDLGSSVSLMPLSVAKRLNYHKYQACGISLVLADRSIRLPTGMLEDLPLRIGNVEIPTDFIVLKMDEEPTDPLILRRLFLATARAMIDVCEGTIELNLGKDLKMKFDIKDTLRKPTIEGQLFYVEEMDQLADELLEELSLEDPLQIALTKDPSEGYMHSETKEYSNLLNTFRPVPNILSIEGLDRPRCEVLAVSSIKNSIESSLEQRNLIELGVEC
ncbi:unnamed protein product [Microthlaspi erraticum]|uniref:Aspartic peptidase DDI1-type domain-containing protein n=1 Tax=Microthlaspi erraticum TaxID=1685480 RepID=A0A6D2L8T4_9BRAS|nr:unnamed protein product [Microthlaspi erraticum]